MNLILMLGRGAFFLFNGNLHLSLYFRWGSFDAEIYDPLFSTSGSKSEEDKYHKRSDVDPVLSNIICLLTLH